MCRNVRAVAHAVNDLVDSGLLTEEEGDALVSSAAQTKIGKAGYVVVSGNSAERNLGQNRHYLFDLRALAHNIMKCI